MRVLAVRHIDQNHKNNNVENLAWLCHNCHHLVHNDKVEQTFSGYVSNVLIMVPIA
jgi:predicted HNH restriction endonuclease